MPSRIDLRSFSTLSADNLPLHTDHLGRAAPVCTDPAADAGMDSAARVTTDLVGREMIVTSLLRLTRQGRSVLLIGAEGMGKTAILRAVADRARGSGRTRLPIYCGDASTLKQMLRSLAEELLAVEADRARSAGPARPPATSVRRPLSASLSIAALRRLVLPRLGTHAYAVLLDLPGAIRGRYADFLDHLTEDLSVPLVVAARSLAPDETGRLWWVGARFRLIEVPALTRAEAHQVATRLLDRSHVILPDREAFVGELVTAAKGNPRLITRICEMARAPRYQAHGRTDLRLILLDLKIHDFQESIHAETQMRLRGPVSLETTRSD
jgi:hypothetical protein